MHNNNLQLRFFSSSKSFLQKLFLSLKILFFYSAKNNQLFAKIDPWCKEERIIEGQLRADEVKAHVETLDKDEQNKIDEFVKGQENGDVKSEAKENWVEFWEKKRFSHLYVNLSEMYSVWVN